MFIIQGLRRMAAKPQCLSSCHSVMSPLGLYVSFGPPQAQIRCMDTICTPTKDHQRSLAQLIAKVDAMVVAGGNDSNNTRELTLLCREHGIPTCQVETAHDLDLGWLASFETVGLTAGTSALDATIDEVEQALWAVVAFERPMR